MREYIYIYRQFDLRRRLHGPRWRGQMSFRQRGQSLESFPAGIGSRERRNARSDPYLGSPS
jgi:hypothetical protein